MTENTRLKESTLLITGATGFVGQEIVRNAIQKDNLQVRIAVRKSSTKKINYITKEKTTCTRI